VWDQTTGGGVLVAVIDSGADLESPEFVRADGSAVIVDAVNVTPGADLRSNLEDEVGHGNEMASIIAGPKNGFGRVGVACGADLLVIKAVADGAKTVDGGSLMDGIDYAIQAGAKVINLSLGVPVDVEAVHQKVCQAHDAGVIVVSITGNGGPDGLPEAPAMYEDCVFSVSAIGPLGNVWSGATPGIAKTYVVPGVRVRSTEAPGIEDEDPFEDCTGTSCAGAGFSGVAALTVARFPGISPDCFRQGLDASGKSLGESAFGAPQRTVDVPELFEAIELAGCAQ
jgi:subtilisin family serine protease